MTSPSKKYGIFFGLLLIIQACSGFTGSASRGFNAVVSQIASFQTEGGGFLLSQDSLPSLEATSYALFLSSLFGLRDKINPNEITKFMSRLHNNDGGYANLETGVSDLESVRFALLCYQHLGGAIPNADSVAVFVRNSYDKSANMFKNRAKAKPDIKATAFALQSFDLLGGSERPDVSKIKKAIKSNLGKFVKSDKNGKRFAFSGFDDLEGDYYGIATAKLVGFDFGDVKQWAKYIVAKQVTVGDNIGGFKGSKGATVKDSSFAVRSLAELPGLEKDYGIDATNLLNFLEQKVRHDIREAVTAHTAVALTSAYEELFTIQISYDVLDNRVGGIVGPRVIQGIQLKPVVTVKTVYGFAHAGLDIGVKIAHRDDGKQVKLQYNSETQQYVSAEFYDTKEKLGDLSFDYDFGCVVIDLGSASPVKFQRLDEKRIGYGINVRSEANLGGKEIAVGDIVGIGTDFEFGVALRTQESSSLSKGDFSVVFSVLDSSSVSIHSETLDCSSNTKPIAFKYTLTSSDIPSGSIDFQFQVKNKDGVHTTHTVQYQSSIPMVATAIKFSNFGKKDKNDIPQYKVGDTIKVEMVPASLPDLRTVKTYSKKHAADRKFFMDILTNTDARQLLSSIPGKPKDGTYVFSLPVAASFDSLGSNLVSFRYETTKGKSIDLSPYDSDIDELMDETVALGYTVASELSIVDVKDKPKGEQLYYGNVVAFTYKVKDSVSGQFIWPGKNRATTYMLLRHKDAKRNTPFVSAKQAADVKYDKSGKPDRFAISWAVNPNAVNGKGQLVLAAEGPDGSHIPLYKGDSKKDWALSVVIGGTIDIDAVYHTFGGQEDSRASFIASFNLSCKGKALSGALLHASVSIVGDDEEIASVPVVRTQAGSYQISWTAEEPKSGEYVIDVYREVDRQRAIDTDATAKPLLSLSLHFNAGAYIRLPVRTEFLFLVAFLGLFISASYKKIAMEGENKKRR